jgi:hypothetical protein
MSDIHIACHGDYVELFMRDMSLSYFKALRLDLPEVVDGIL